MGKVPPELRKYLVALGRKGGEARAKALTPERRRRIAVRAIRARWDRAKAKRKGVSR